MPTPSSTKHYVHLDTASQVADEILQTLWPACERIELAGSIRRQRQYVGDIEIVAIPRIRRQLDLFSRPVPGQTISELDELADALRAARRLTPRPAPDGKIAWGQRYKRAVYRPQRPGLPTMAVDLFAVLPPAEWGVIMAIRTGPANLSKLLVTPRAQGGLLPDGFRVQRGRLISPTGMPIPTPEETDLFKLLKLRYIPARDRAQFFACLQAHARTRGGE